MPASTTFTRPNSLAMPTLPEELLPAQAGPSMRPCAPPADEAAVVYIDGEIDAGTAPELAELVQCRIESAVTTVVVDLSQVEFLGVAGVSVLSVAALQAEQEHVALRLVTGPRCVDRALRVIDGLRERLACYSSLDEALRG